MQLDFAGVHVAASVEGDGPAIVLLHGFPLAGESWNAQAAILGKRAKVIRFDLRGLGASSAPPGPYLMETLASDCSDVLDALGIGSATIVGHSLGGYVAFAFFRLFSERCAGLGLVATRAPADDAATAAMRETLADQAERDGMQPIVETFLPRYFAPEVYDRRPDIVQRTTAIMTATKPQGAAAMLRGMAARVSSEDLFEEIAIPVRVVGCRADALAGFAASQAMADGISGAVLDVLPCGHLPMLEEPEALANALVGLLDDVEGRMPP